jgi:hypothetical protein
MVNELLLATETGSGSLTGDEQRVGLGSGLKPTRPSKNRCAPAFCGGLGDLGSGYGLFTLTRAGSGK